MHIFRYFLFIISLTCSFRPYYKLYMQGYALLYAGAGVRTPDTPLILLKKGEF